MSRIEIALEKAARMRAKSPGAVPPPETVDPAAPKLKGPRNPNIVTITAPDSPAAEEYRKLKAMVVKITSRDAARNIIMITSCTSGEGKSLTAINLAVSLAQEVSHRALLIDADLRRPCLADYLGIRADKGLSDCLRDGTSAASAVIRTGIPKLGILPAGRSVRNPVELLSSPKMKILLHELKRQYSDGYIIIDTPPILPFAETQIISLVADGVLLVVKEGATTAQDMQDSLDLLKGTRVLGIAFNEVSQPAMNNRYRNYYHYYAAREQRKV
jgi:exopolysaccharide/PEP-CTERM locus tyrosine autokinase